MNIKNLCYVSITLIVFLLLFQTLGLGITTLIIAFIILTQAIVFSLKPEYHDKFYKLVNTTYYNALKEKDDEYIRKSRKMNIISSYVLTVILGFNAYMQIFIQKYRFTFTVKQCILIYVAFMGFLLLINYISVFILKKSKTVKENFVYSFVLGIGITIIIIGGLAAFIISSVFS